MAPKPHTLIFLLFLASAAASTNGINDAFLQSERRAPEPAPQKLSHFRFFWHDLVTGADPTAITVVGKQVTNATSPFFGSLVVIDDPLTAGPELSSAPVGRAQGFYLAASKTELAVLMDMNFVFTAGGKYEGSSLSVTGRNKALAEVRELAVVGGTGLFRGATGYCLLRTNSFNGKGDVTVEYNVYVTHSD